ncbi:carbohydrate binding domain protein [Striga asiatica]|uniref:Carbohydrate binding domain protein n=1 Tax=Striga asiatica TaxID=4170 RepID=A0A5A7NVG3_STRAF|nr:carbohydrate binding domain protein [Striga asiatica]
MGPKAAKPAALHAWTTSLLPSGLLVTITTSASNPLAAFTLISATLGRVITAVSCTITLPAFEASVIHPLISAPTHTSAALGCRRNDKNTQIPDPVATNKALLYMFVRYGKPAKCTCRTHRCVGGFETKDLVKSPTAPASIMCSFLPSEIIPNACHSENGDGLIRPRIPDLTPPSNLMMEACPDGDETCTLTFLTVSHGTTINTTVSKTKAHRRARAAHPANRWVRSNTLWWMCRRSGNAASADSARRPRIAAATPKASGGVPEPSFAARTRA